MKVAILCGGRGTRISELTNNIPKPMIKISGKPILYHIMKHYSHYGFKDFIVAAGYKKYVIIDKKFYRPFEVRFLKGDSKKARKQLKWKPKVTMHRGIKILLKK